jgi:hypothetical protein
MEESSMTSTKVSLLKYRYTLNGLADIFFIGIFIAFIFLALAAFTIGFSEGAATLFMSGVFLSVIIGLLFYSSQWNRAASFLKRRDALLAQLTEESKWEFQKQPLDFGIFNQSSLNFLTKGRHVFNNLITTKQWSYADYIYEVGGSEDSADFEGTVYYSVIGIKLPRKMPNVFFDSKKLRNDQFKKIFTQDQVFNLEYQFERYFIGYFPSGYVKDIMSYITPDIMEALVAADDYDIEIVGDRLFLYGYMSEGWQTERTMLQQALKLSKQMQHGVKTYRDERLPYKEGREGVALGGLELARQRLRLTLGAIYTAVFFTVYTAITIGSILARTR